MSDKSSQYKSRPYKSNPPKSSRHKFLIIGLLIVILIITGLLIWWFGFKTRSQCAIDDITSCDKGYYCGSDKRCKKCDCTNSQVCDFTKGCTTQCTGTLKCYKDRTGESVGATCGDDKNWHCPPDSCTILDDNETVTVCKNTENADIYCSMHDCKCGGQFYNADDSSSYPQICNGIKLSDHIDNACPGICNKNHNCVANCSETGWTSTCYFPGSYYKNVCDNVTDATFECNELGYWNCKCGTTDYSSDSIATNCAIENLSCNAQLNAWVCKD